MIFQTKNFLKIDKPESLQDSFCENCFSKFIEINQNLECGKEISKISAKKMCILEDTQKIKHGYTKILTKNII